jgi:NAD(P)-dependent dehydrogenase (short-subunit alcohol dehydrogenase family)
MERTAIITGAYGAIGKAIAEGIARAGYRLYLVGRDPEKLESTRKELVIKTSSQHIYSAMVDLSSHHQIKAFAETWEQPLHLLVNNAATAPKHRTLTSDGIEVQWAVNVLSYVRLIELLKRHMPDQAGARIVNVASYWAGGLRMDDLEFTIRKYDNDTAYRQAKQANRMMSAAYGVILNERGITVNACHPGDVNSKLSNAFGFGGHETPAQGAATPLYLALDKELEGVTGAYFEHRQKVSCSFSKNQAENQRLLNLCLGYPM